MRLGQVLPVGSFPFEKIRNSIQAKSVNTHTAPVVQYLKHFLLYQGAVIIKIRLVIKETVPVVLLGYCIPRPVRRFKILKNDPDVFVLTWIICPDIIIAFERTLRGLPGP